MTSVKRRHDRRRPLGGTRGGYGIARATDAELLSRRGPTREHLFDQLGWRTVRHPWRLAGTPTGDVVIRRPVQDVYRFYRNFANLPRFLGDVVAVEQVTTQPTGGSWPDRSAHESGSPSPSPTSTSIG